MTKKPEKPKRTEQEETPTTTVGEDGGDGDGDDTEVGPAPVEDEWDGPTREVAAEEVAALAMKSAAVPEDGAVLGEGDAETVSEPPPGEVPGRLANVLESLLFAADKPLAVADLSACCSASATGQADHRSAGGACARGGPTAASSWSRSPGAGNCAPTPATAPGSRELVGGKPQRLSRAMLETLAIVAYRQPMTRPEIDEIRGVDCGPVLRTLLDRGLIRMIGKKEEVGRPILYGTTPEFLKTFSLRDLTELPTLREFHELGDDDRAKVDSVAPASVGSGSPLAGAATPGADTLPSASELPTYDRGKRRT